MTLLDTYNGFIGALATGQPDCCPHSLTPAPAPKPALGSPSRAR